MVPANTNYTMNSESKAPNNSFGSNAGKKYRCTLKKKKKKKERNISVQSIKGFSIIQNKIFYVDSGRTLVTFRHDPVIMVRIDRTQYRKKEGLRKIPGTSRTLTNSAPTNSAPTIRPTRTLKILLHWVDSCTVFKHKMFNLFFIQPCPQKITCP